MTKDPNAENPENSNEADQDTGAPDVGVVEKVDSEQLQHFVTAIKSAAQQVGENIIQALQHDGTVAVLTTVVIGEDGHQQVVSAALKPELMEQVQSILMQAQQEREDEELCVGFHCLVKPKRETQA